MIRHLLHTAAWAAAGAAGVLAVITAAIALGSWIA